MRTIARSDLSAASVWRSVAEGSTVSVTSYGKPSAELVPIGYSARLFAAEKEARELRKALLACTLGKNSEALGIARDMQGQDTCGSAHPVYTVQERVQCPIWTTGDSFGGYSLNTDPDGWNLYEDGELSATCDDEPGDAKGWIPWVWEWRAWDGGAVFLTYKAAAELIERKRHDLCQPQVCVESAYWSREMQTIQDALLAIEGDP